MNISDEVKELAVSMIANMVEHQEVKYTDEQVKIMIVGQAQGIAEALEDCKMILVRKQ